MLHRHLIPKHPQPNNHARRLVAKITMMPPRLARMHIAHMQLDERDLDAQQRIADRHRGVRERPRVDHNAVDGSARRVDAVDDGAFVVGLEGVQRGAERGGLRLCGGFDVGEGRAAVDVWLAGAEEVEVGAVDEEDGLRGHFVV